MVNESGNGRSATAVNPRTSVLLAAGMGIAAMLGAHAESSTPLTPARIFIGINAVGAPISPAGGADFVVKVGNSGGAAATDQRLVVAVPDGIRTLGWTCSAHAGGRCAVASGSGALDVPLQGLAANSTLEFAFHAVADAAPPAFIEVAARAGQGASDLCDSGESAPCRAFLRMPTGASVSLDVRSSATALVPGQSVQYTVTARTLSAVASTSGTVVRSPVPSGLIDSRWTCRSSVGACAAASGNGAIEQVLGDFSRGDVQFQINATVAANPPATIVQAAVAVPPAGGSCAGSGADYRPAPCTARKELSTRPRMMVSRSEGYRATATTISTRYVFENAGAAADGSRISAALPANATGLAWTCTAQGMQCPQASGNGAIAQTVASWPSSAKLIYDLSVTSPLATTKDLVATMQVTPPQGASCGKAGAPPPCTATQALPLDHSGLRLQQRLNRLGAGAGELIGYVVNIGSDADAGESRDVVLSVPLPEGIDAFVSWSCMAAAGSATSCPVRSGKGAIRQAFPLLAASSDLIYFIHARVGSVAPATVVARSSLTAPVAASLGCAEQGRATLGCVASSEFSTVPVLALEQSILANVLSPGSPFDYVLDVFNLGAKADAVRVRNLLPAGISNVSWICHGLGMDCPASIGSGSVSSTLQQMPAGAGVRYQVAATAGNSSPASTSSILMATPSAGGRCHHGATRDVSSAPCTDRVDSNHAPMLELRQSASEQQLLRGGAVHHVLAVLNHGAATEGTRLSLPLPPGVKQSSWTCAGFGGAVCPSESGVGAIDEVIPTLPANASISYAIESELAGDARTRIDMAASVVPADVAQCSADSCVDTLALPVTAVPSAHLQVTVASAEARVRAGSDTTWTIDVRNLGNEIAGAFSIVDTRPPNAVRVSSWTCDGVECPAASGVGPIDQVVAALSIHDSSSSEKSVAPGRIVFTVHGQVAETAQDDAELAVNLQPRQGDTCAPVDCTASQRLPLAPLGMSVVEISLGTENSFVSQASSITYFFDASNFGSTQVDNVPVYTIEPAGVVSSSWTCTGSGGASCPSSGSGPINEVIGSLPPDGGSVRFVITAQTADSLPANFDFVAGANPAAPTTCTPPSCSVTSSLPSEDQLVLALDANTGVVQPDSTIEYTYSIVNGGGRTSFGFTVYSEPPPEFITSSWTCAGIGVECVPSGSGPLADSIPFLPAGASVTYTISATVGAELPASIDYLVGVDFGRMGAPTGLLNCLPFTCMVSSSLPTGTGAPAQMSISKSANRTNLFAGGGVRYTVSFANIGSTMATSVQLVDDIPPGLTSFFWTCSAAGDASCEVSSGSGPLNEFFPFVAPGSSVTYTIDADVASNASGTVTNVAQLTGDNIVCDPFGCDASNALSVTVPTDLVVTKTVSPASGTPVGVNQPIVWTLLATNDGGATPGALTMADTLPDGIRDIVIGLEAGVTCTPMQPLPGQTLICTIPAGFQGERHVTISATVNAAAGTTLSNTVRANAGNNGVTCMDCTVSNLVEGSFDLALVNPRPFSAGGVNGTLIDVVNLSAMPVSGASLVVTPVSALRLLSPFSGSCTATVGDDGNVSVACPVPPSPQGVSCSGNTCSVGALDPATASTIFVALNGAAPATVRISTTGDSNPSNNSIELPVGGTP